MEYIDVKKLYKLNPGDLVTISRKFRGKNKEEILTSNGHTQLAAHFMTDNDKHRTYRWNEYGISWCVTNITSRESFLAEELVKSLGLDKEEAEYIVKEASKQSWNYGNMFYLPYEDSFYLSAALILNIRNSGSPNSKYKTSLKITSTDVIDIYSDNSNLLAEILKIAKENAKGSNLLTAKLEKIRK